MRWKGRRQSQNVEDRRGLSGPKMAAGGGIGVLIIALIAMFTGGDPSKLLEQLGNAGSVGASQGSGAGNEEYVQTPEEAEMREFVGVVMGDTEEVWDSLIKGYKKPGLVLFRDAVQSACGQQSSAVGPFYCPADQKAYLDLRFFDQLAARHSAAGDFAQAYVIAHEVGHHIQNLLGTSGKVNAQRQRVSAEEGNQLSVRLELQADFYAGVWAHHAQKRFDILEPGDINEALNAASQIGDDTLQKKATGRVSPEGFTHGTGEQRVRWFRRGFESGDVRQGDTFAMAYSSL